MPVAATNRRLQIQLPEALYKDLQEIAKSRGIGVGTLIRMLLYASLERKAA